MDLSARLQQFEDMVRDAKSMPLSSSALLNRDEVLELIQDMKDANTIWSVQIYPDTPIGSYTWYGASLDVAIDAAIAAMQPKEPS